MGLSHVVRPCAVLLIVLALSGCVAMPGDGTDDGPTIEDKEVVWGPVADAKIRPGVRLGDYCTFNWLWTDTAGHGYIGTAGHCTEKIGERVSLADGQEIGVVVFDSDDAVHADPLIDFSLVLLDEDRVAAANPTMLGYDAPHGFVTETDVAAGDLVGLHGYGMVLGENPATRDRQGALVSMTDQRYQADMPAVYGDSGAPLVHVDTGKALGIISQFGFLEVPPSTDVGPTISYVLAQLAREGIEVELATAG